MKKLINKPILIAWIILSNLMALGFIAMIVVQTSQPGESTQQGIFQVQSTTSDTADYCKRCNEICSS